MCTSSTDTATLSGGAAARSCSTAPPHATRTTRTSVNAGGERMPCSSPLHGEPIRSDAVFLEEAIEVCALETCLARGGAARALCADHQATQVLALTELEPLLAEFLEA